MVIAFMKGLRFADTQESCFEGWIRSHMCCEALVSSRIAEVQELCFKPEKSSDMGCAELEGGLFADW